MNKKELKNRIALGEGFTTEFKSQLNKDFGRELCAFANATGGMILLGVEDNGTICGIDAHNKLELEVKKLAKTADPKIEVTFNSIDKVLCVNVPKQKNPPYSFKGEFVMREGADNQRMDKNEIGKLFYESGAISHDEAPCQKFVYSKDFSDEKWKLFQKHANIPVTMKPKDALSNLNLLDDDNKMTNAGAWLLAKDIRKYNASAYVTCAKFAGSTNTTILDNVDFAKDVYSNLNDAVKWVYSNINIANVISGKVDRDDVPELPIDAIREAIVNAITHRSYRSTGSIKVFLFQDRLEIVSPGGLPGGLTEADLGTRNAPRNPLLQNIMHIMGAVEKIGTGIGRMRDLCKEHGVNEPIFNADDNWFTVVFPRLDKQTNKGAESGQSQGRVRAESKTFEMRVIYALKNAPLAKSEIAKILGKKSITGQLGREIKSLLKGEFIEYTKPDKPNSRLQKYRLTAKGKKLLDEG